MGPHHRGSGTHGLLLSQRTHIGMAIHEETLHSLVDVGPSADVLDQLWEQLDINQIRDIPSRGPFLLRIPHICC